MYLSVMKQPRMKVWLLSLIQMPQSSLLPLSPTTHLLNRLPFIRKLLKYPGARNNMRKTTVYDPIVFMWLVDVQGLKLDYLWVYSDLSI